MVRAVRDDGSGDATGRQAEAEQCRVFAARASLFAMAAG
jgi:hypothetical protein